MVRRFWLSTVGQRIVHVLEPSKWWVALFVTGLVSVNVWTLTIYRSQAKDEATHTAEIIASADGQYGACARSIPLLTRINEFIVDERIIRNALVRNSRRNHLADPSSRVKTENYNQLKKARAEAYQVKFPIPTAKECGLLRSRLLRSN